MWMLFGRSQRGGAEQDRRWRFDAQIPGLLADRLGDVRQHDEGLKLLQQAIQHIERSGERATEAETYRLYAKLLAARDMADFPAAEANLEKAIEIARAQQARGWELRAVTTLARMLQQRDQRRKRGSASLPSMNGSRKASTHPISRRPEHCSLSFNRGMIGSSM